MFTMLYVLLFALWVFLLDRTIRKGPQEHSIGETAGGASPVASAISARAAHEQAAEDQPERSS